jgi:DNA processing protein
MIGDDTLARLRLLKLANMGPARIDWLLGTRDPQVVVEALLAGRLPDDLGPPPPGVNRRVVEAWQAGIRGVEVDSVLATNRRLGIRMLSPRDPDWPLADDPEPPALLFVRGDDELLQAPMRVAIVGTRRCTTVGRTVADRLGRDVAVAGGTVVSGLALGVDGSAHRGALEHGSAVIGVVGSGLDVVYPRANRRLWDAVGARGLLVSEAPSGAGPQRWRFPARNRLIAALSEAVVVVESHRRGGALSTVDEAIRRDRPVMAVPGSVLSPASEGTNSLLVDGAIPVRDARDVLGYLGYPDPVEGVRSPDRPNPVPGHRLPAPGGIGSRIMAEVATGPQHIDQLILATGSTVADLLTAIQELQAGGLVVADGSTVALPPPPG